MISQPTHEIPPPEVITEILCRLPAKSVGRFRCVSTGWLSLLTDPEFIKTHTEKTLKQHHLIFESKIRYDLGYHGERSVNLYSHPFNEIVVTTPTKFSFELECGASLEEITFSNSCDGLVLVRCYCEEWPLFTFFLVNPTTRENLQLPQDYIHKVHVELKHVEDLNTKVTCGFGYDSVNDDYKVVTVTYFNYYTSDVEDADKVEDLYVHVHVYSLKSNTWRRVIESPYNYSESTDGVFVNGYIHWIVSKADNLLVISAFSLADESFKDVPFPNSCNALKEYTCELVVLGGKLAIFLENKDEIWLLNEYGITESWTQISLHGINQIPLFQPKERYLKPKPVVMDGNSKILVANNDRMMVYEVDKGTFSETHCVWNPKNLSVFGSYVESLVSLKHNVTKQNSTKSNEGEEKTHPERQTGKRKDICSSNVPSKHVRVDFYSGSADMPEPSNREILDLGLTQHRLEGIVPPYLDQEDFRISNSVLNSVDSFEAIGENLQATGHVVEKLSRDIKEKNVMKLDIERKVSQDYDSWKAKHQEEKLRADRLEEEMNHALSKHKFLIDRLEENEATIQSNLVELQSLVEKNEELLEKSRALDTTNAEIESLKAKLALAEELVRKY